MKTGTAATSYFITVPCQYPMVEDDRGCQVEEWIRTDGLPTGFLTCERHLGFSGHISWPDTSQEDE